MSEPSNHLLNVGEWEDTTFRNITLNAKDKELIEILNAERKRLEVHCWGDQIRITAKSWIGVVYLDSVVIRIHPKLSGDNLNVLRMLDFVQGTNHLRFFKRSGYLSSGDDDLMELLITLFVTETELLINKGLLTDYREHDDLLGAVRGRILSDRQILQRYGQIDKVHCRFDDRTTDILENQILASVLWLCHRLELAASLKKRIHRCIHELAQHCSTNIDVAITSENIVYHRLNGHYQPAHVLAKLICNMTGLKDFSHGQVRCNSFLFDMNRLFERFVEKLLASVLQDSSCRVVFQKPDTTFIRNADSGKTFAHTKPDVLIWLHDRPGCIPLDAKYKELDQKKISSGDLYQLFAYSQHFSAKSLSKRALIIYPARTQGMPPLRLHVGTDEVTRVHVSVVGIHIPTLLDELDKIGANTTALASLDQLIRMEIEKTEILR